MNVIDSKASKIMRTRAIPSPVHGASQRRSIRPMPLSSGPNCRGLAIRVLAAVVWLLGGASVTAGEFSLSIVDAATKQPVAARVYVTNAATGQRHFVRSLSDTAAVIYEKQNWLNRNSIEHHTSAPAAVCIAENLAEGTYEVTVERGKEYFPESRSIELAEGEKRPVETIALRRWVNLAERGWFSGETHLHRPLQELPVVLQAEDLNVAMPLTYWVTQAFTPPAQGNKNQDGEIPDRLITVDATHVIWPRNTEYEIFTVGEKQHTLGALFVLNHHSVLDKGAPDWKPIAEQARREGALLDMDKLDWPFGMTLPKMSGATLYELANNHVWRTEFGFTKWNTPAPAFLQPPSGGAGGNELDWLNYTFGQFYVLLDAGFPLVPTAGTASGVHPVPAGFSRVYVKCEGGFSYDAWLDGLRMGRSFVTTGPMIFAECSGQPPGAKLEGGEVQLTATILSEHPLRSVELVANNLAVTKLTPRSSRTVDGAHQNEITIDVPIAASGWLCLRCFEERPDGRVRFAHTAPWRFEVPDRPLRPTRQQRDYLVARIRSEMTRSAGVLPGSAMAEYEESLRHAESLPVVEDHQFGAIEPEFTAVAATDAGLWPELHLAKDGALLALGYNAPAHTTLPGDIDCWASTDGGRSWSKRATAAPRPQPDANYCHFASGFTPAGEFIVLASGLDDAANQLGGRRPNDVGVFHSNDLGQTWKAGGEFPKLLPGERKPYPFGTIVAAADGSLRSLAYTTKESGAAAEAAWMLTSRDGGHSWTDPIQIAAGVNEAAVLPLTAASNWLCVARTSDQPAPEFGQELRQFRSVDNGLTWTDEGRVAGYHQHPPHLLRTGSGGLLLTYGNRRDGFIEVRFSDDDALTWGLPQRLFRTGPGDMGYPQTVETSEGRFVTVFYAKKTSLHDGYHLGVLGWRR